VARYYFVVLSLPPLTFGSRPEMSYKELKLTLDMNLTPRDAKRFQILMQPIDLYNIKALWQSLPLDDRGTIPTKELEEALLVRDNLPTYLLEFLEKYDTQEDRLRYFAYTYAAMLRRKYPGFLGWYIQFEREVRLVLTALRSKKWKKDLLKELQFEDSKDPFVMQILAQKDAPDYDPPAEYQDLKELFLKHAHDPKELNLAILKYRFDKIGEIEGQEHFTLDRILAYTARLLVLEKMTNLESPKAKEMIENLSAYG
jgi:hypothetical protein